jgi:multiple sugar transport system ATP-binding protein
MASVTFDNVSKAFESGSFALKDFSLTIPDREFLVLVGPSGSGKSTALRCLAGLEEITDGQILIGDRAVNNVAPRDRDIAMVFQSYALYPHMTVHENMAFGLSLRKLPKEEIARRVNEAAAILGIEPLLKRKPRALSGGQRQRVALGRAIVREPSVFLLDEPLSNLDAKLRVQTRAEISKLHARLGTTFIYVTHDQVEAMTMATRIAVLNFGELQQVGTPSDLYDSPRNTFVAGFIGSPSMNFFDATVTQSGDGVRLEAPGMSLPPPSRYRDVISNYVGKTVNVGVRPEAIHDFNFQPTGAATTKVEASVDVTELMGSEIISYVIIDGQTLVARFDPRSGARPGQPITLAFETDRMHLFDVETKLALGIAPEEPVATVDTAVSA